MASETETLVNELTSLFIESQSFHDFFLLKKENVALSFHDFVEIHDSNEKGDGYPEYVVAEFYGGLNGSGQWTNYLKAISELFNIISWDYRVWLVDLSNDCLDDVFYLKVGIRRKTII